MSNRGPLQPRENLPQMSAPAQKPKTAQSDYGPNYPKGKLHISSLVIPNL